MIYKFVKPDFTVLVVAPEGDNIATLILPLLPNIDDGIFVKTGFKNMRAYRSRMEYSGYKEVNSVIEI